MKKKAVILYRVSTDQQDFALQKNKNRNYCKDNDIEIVGEYTEFDVSGYKTQLKNRTELLKIMARAEEDKDFDYFVIYNFDRIIRREDEAPFILNHLSKFNIECIEATTGDHIRSEDMSDKLMNYIRFWQAEYESVKTSQRVTDAIRTKNENNEYTGGVPAYGYETYDTENFSKTGRRLKDMRINESEAWIIRDIFDMYVNKKMGSLSISEELNTNPLYQGKNRPIKRKGVLQPTRFRQNSIIRMIKNPVYIGRQRYNTVKTTRDGVDTLSADEWKLKDYNEKLHIIDENLFNRAQELVIENTIVKNVSKTKVTKSGVLCSGIAFCECGAKLFSSFSRYWYTKKDGSKTETLIYRYCCRDGRETNKLHKEKYGKTYYAAKKYDKLIQKTIIEYLGSIDLDKLKENINKHNNSGIVQIEQTIENLKKESNQCYKNIANFETKIDEDIENMDIYIKGIRRNEARTKEIDEAIDELRDELLKNKTDDFDYKELHDNFKSYYDTFLGGNLEKQKLVIGQLVEKVILKNNGVKIVLKTVIHDSLDIMNKNSVYYAHHSS